MNETLVANKWYPEFSKIRKSYNSPYPTPQSILRSSVGASEYKFLSETVTTDHIRAAVVIASDVPFQHLLNEPWGMSYRTEHWRMLIVSTLDPMRWIELARATGAIAWLKGHNMSCTYNWEPPELDSTGNKVRPPNALGVTTLVNGKVQYKKKYDLDEVLSDLRCGYLSTNEIGIRYNITASTVQTIAKRAGIRLHSGPKRLQHVKT